MIRLWCKIMGLLYKICPVADWAKAAADGAFTGSGDDYTSGFIHLSSASQVHETARRHFAGIHDLVLVAMEEEALSGLKWEKSRGGDSFPHVYGVIPVSAARWVRPLPLKNGAHVFPGEFRR